MASMKRTAALILVAALLATSTVGQAAELGLTLEVPRADLAAPALGQLPQAAALPGADLSLSLAPSAVLPGVDAGAAAQAVPASREDAGAMAAAMSAAGDSSKGAPASSGGESQAAQSQVTFDHAALGRANDEGLPINVQTAAFSRVIAPGERFQLTLPLNGMGSLFAAADAGADGRHILAVTKNKDGKPFHTGTLLRITAASAEDGKITVHGVALREALITDIQERAPGTRADVSYHDVDLAPAADLARLATVLLNVKTELVRAGSDWQPVIELADRGDARAVANHLLAYFADKMPLEGGQDALAASTISERLAMLLPLLKKLPAAAQPAAKASKSRALTVKKPAGTSEAGFKDQATIAAAIRQQQQAQKDAAAEVEEIRQKIEDSGMPEVAKKRALKELARMQKDKSEHDNIEKWLELMAELPWTRRRKPNVDLKKARAILDSSHAGMEDVKKGMLTDIAVRKRTGDDKGRVIALEGPAGVGKTTIAEEYAKAADLDFVKISLGGKSDEKYLRGIPRFYHNSYVGALLAQLRYVSRNAVVLLDEADTAGGESGGGGLMSALLELLDEKGNLRYKDSYLDVEFDLSDITFIITGNDFKKFPEAVRSRMQRYYIGSYSFKEKMRIAKDYIYERKLKQNALKDIKVTDAALKMIIEQYAIEAGVRQLEFRVNDLLRGVVFENEDQGKPIPKKLDVADVKRILGAPAHGEEQVEPNGLGRSTGLAVSGAGGAVFSVQARFIPHGSGQLVLSEEMDKDTRKSANNAYAELRVRAAELGVDPELFKTHDLHIYFAPSGPVSGPSAGLAMATAIFSAATKRPVKQGVAMTGAIDLYGTAWTIGGLREKVMAAERYGYKMVLFPKHNEANVESIPGEVQGNIELHEVKTFDDVIKYALEPAPAMP